MTIIPGALGKQKRLNFLHKAIGFKADFTGQT